MAAKALDIEVTRHVDAPPERVWELVGDPTRMGELSPECYHVQWLGGATAPAVGARFRGTNRKGLLRWSTTGTVTAHEPGREIAWNVSMVGQPVARWGFTLAPEGEGTRVVQTWQDRRTRLASLVGKARTSDSPTHNRAGMEQTLDTLRRTTEQGSGPR